MKTRFYGSYKVEKHTYTLGGVQYEVKKFGGEFIEAFDRLRDAKALCIKLNAEPKK